jgi:hypothetical protein
MEEGLVEGSAEGIFDGIELGWLYFNNNMSIN